MRRVILSFLLLIGLSHGDALAATLAELAQSPGLENIVRYQHAAGHPEHRAAGAPFMARVRKKLNVDVGQRQA